MDPKVLEAIKAGGAPLKHVDGIEHDASAPAIEPGTGVGKWDKDALLQGIEQGVKLKHVETVDKAKPLIEPGTHITTNPHKQLLDEIKGGGVQLKHVEPEVETTPQVVDDNA